MQDLYSTIFGSKSSQRVLFYLAIYEEGHAHRIAKTYGAAVSPIQAQLNKYENSKNYKES